MSTHSFTVQLPVPAPNVEALLGTYPSAWLRRFLRLASLGASERPGAPEAPGLYQLGPLEGAGPATAKMTWWPRAGDTLFECFDGQFVVHPVEDGTALSLAGETDGGDHDTNVIVLRSVVELIGAALRADQPRDG